MHLLIKLQKKMGKLLSATPKMKTDFEHFVTLLENDDLVEAYFEKIVDDASLPQIKKIHKMFRIMSEHSGYTVEEIKILVKESCGLAYSKIINGERYVIPLKSIGDMSKTEISNLMEGTIRFAETNYLMTLD